MEKRLEKVRIFLKKLNIDALLISSSYNICYLTEFDGFSNFEREGYALLTDTDIYILTDPRLSEGARKKTSKSQVKVVELTKDSGLTKVLKEIFISKNVKSVGFEENLTFLELKKLKKSGGKWKMTEEIIETARRIKDNDEIKSIEKACSLTDMAFSHATRNIKRGMSEQDLAWVIEKYIRENRGELAFPTIVAYGANSAIPHHKTSNRKLKPNEIVLIDFGVKFNNYSSDMTRTLYFGHASNKFKKMYMATLNASSLAYRAKSSKTLTGHSIDKAARDYIVKAGYPSIPHSVGHGVGLEVHELPHISPGFKEEIQKNTVFTIEPGIYINGYGGVRIEDTVLFDGKSIIPLTKSPKDLMEI